jgi:hypothetical protein
LALDAAAGIFVATRRNGMVTGNFGTDEVFVGAVAKPRDPDGWKDFDCANSHSTSLQLQLSLRL